MQAPRAGQRHQSSCSVTRTSTDLWSASMSAEASSRPSAAGRRPMASVSPQDARFLGGCFKCCARFCVRSNSLHRVQACPLCYCVAQPLVVRPGGPQACNGLSSTPDDEKMIVAVYRQLNVCIPDAGVHATLRSSVFAQTLVQAVGSGLRNRSQTVD
jgi:hypothetical protein